MRYEGKDNLEILELAKNYNNFLVSLVTNFKDRNPQKIVDFGSGTGFLSQLIARKMETVVCCVENADNLKECYASKNELVLFSSLENIEDNSVDILYSFNVLEHIEDDRKIVGDLCRKIKKGGVLILYVPAFKCLFSSMDVKVGHYRRYNKKMLCDLLDTEHFNIMTCDYCDFSGFFVTLLYKLIGSKDGQINKKMLWLFDRFIFPIGRLFDKMTKGIVCGKNVLLVGVKKTS